MQNIVYTAPTLQSSAKIIWIILPGTQLLIGSSLADTANDRLRHPPLRMNGHNYYGTT